MGMDCYAYTIEQLKDYLKLVNKITGECKINYTRRNSLNIGRLNASCGIQYIQKTIRSYILGGVEVKDIDIVNCHPSLVNYLMDEYGIKDRFIKKYCKDRTNTIREYTLSGKEEVCCIINSDKISNDNHPYVITFHENIYGQNGLLNKMRTTFKNKKDKTIEKIFKMVEKKRTKNIKGSVFNYILCYYEDIILGHMVDFIKERGMTIRTLMYDGL